MSASPIPRLRINWYRAHVPEADLRVYGLPSPEYGEFRAERHVRQYTYGSGYLAVTVAAGIVPAGFSDVALSPRVIPALTSTLIYEASLEHFAREGYQVERTKGQGYVLRARYIEGLPNVIVFREGLVLKPYYVGNGDRVAFGLVIDYSTSQELTGTLADDSVQRDLSQRGYEVTYRRDDGSFGSGWVRSCLGNKVEVEHRGDSTTVDASDVRLRASYHAIREYMERSGIAAPSAVIRMLQTQALSITAGGYSNIRRLADRYERVASLMGRTRHANLNLTLPTACLSVVSLETEPADVEVRSS